MFQNHWKNPLIPLFLFKISILSLVFLGGCSNSGGSDDNFIPSNSSTPVATQDPRIEFSGVGPNGVFDPSLAEDGSSRIWMSYSEVIPSPTFGIAFNSVQTRIAFSEDQGFGWTDAGLVVNSATSLQLPPPNDIFPANRIHEVSALVYDPNSPSAERWKMLWHTYVNIFDTAQNRSLRLFEHGWIGLKTAPSPTGPWSVERKLFSGSGYDSVNDSFIGPPEFRLDQLFPALANCLAFTEPGLLVKPDGIYVSLKCGSVVDPKVILLKCANDFSTCQYQGTFLNDNEASNFGANYTGFSATEMFSKDNKDYLMVTPTEGDNYRGCFVFEIANLATASLVETGGIPLLMQSVFGTAGSFNGAGGYTAGSTASGIIYSEAFINEAPVFRLFKSEDNL